MPSLADTFRALVDITASGIVGSTVLATGQQALAGWLLAAAIGCGLGLLAGHVDAVGDAVAPLATMVFATPPIVWVVLALLWFGPGSIEPMFTVVMSTFPIIFASCLQGVRGRDKLLDEMASTFNVPRMQHTVDVVLPQVWAQVLPALATTIAYAWKVAIMAEMLGGGTGLGGQLATARANLDMPEMMAWISVILALVLVCDGLLLMPFRRYLNTRFNTLKLR
ncbi:ABC transporter permease subunit [Hyphomicrobium sp. D-2]|uniref:ABC transporter permease n=1 Tax=Hyphomicrobium sp. D-2 TaxID=3041621 RepID=UPI00245586C8|nr:ABC transporter permease subunit [Hyphomicrobium sp. D-2]MDH4982407.1 ABC transporter permease subunit [Hyphomicrobium sp. D-2]